MTEAELRRKHAVRVAWSNSTGTLEQLLYGAFYNMPTFEVLSDFASVMGINTIEREWKDVLASRSDRETLRVKPYIEQALYKIRHEPRYFQVTA